ncbi:MAG: RidA family protein [Alphaproteobacteria bacterium]|nr:RidA family protein [Alphaproteobacteria bacterium]
MPRFFNPPTVWKPFSTFSMGAVQGDGRIVHLKGQFPLDLEGQVVGPGDMHTQVRQTLDNVKAMLSHVGGELRDIFSMTHHVTDIRAFMGTKEVRESYFSPPYPVTTTVQVASLFHRDVMIEITAIAEIPRERFKEPA